jgi:hypothetical protein
MIIEKGVNKLELLLDKYKINVNINHSIRDEKKGLIKLIRHGLLILNLKVGTVIEWDDLNQNSIEYLNDIFGRELSISEIDSIKEFVSYRVCYQGTDFGVLLEDCKNKFGVSLPINICWNMVDLSIDYFINHSTKVCCVNVNFENSDNLSKLPIDVQFIFDLDYLVDDNFGDILKNYIITNTKNVIESFIS